MASNDFSGTLQNSITDFEKERDKFLKRTSNKLLKKVKLKTPVGEYDNGQVGGTLRNNWHSKKISNDTREVYNNTEYALMWGI